MTRASARRAAAAYRSVDRSTRARATEPTWLPSGWLAVVLMLTAAAPSLGAPASSDGWRARGSSRAVSAQRSAGAERLKRVRSTTRGDRPAAAGGWASSDGRTNRVIKQVAWEDDLAGPAMRVAGRLPAERAYDRGYRVAQQPGSDGLRDAFERPFGMDDPAVDSDADEADRLFDDLPEEPGYAEEPTVAQPEYTEDAFGAEEQAPAADSLFDDDAPSEAESIDAPQPFDDTYNDDIGSDLADRPEDRQLQADRRSEAMQDCSEALAELKGQRLASIDLSIGIDGVEGEAYPYVCSLEDGSVFTPRCWSEITYTWKASGLCHKPLYFEDIHLERYGHSWGPYVQPLLSGAHFFGTLPVLPYKMGLKTPNECVYTLGHYRPGECAPYLIDPIPFTWRAAIFQAGGTMGVIGILP